MVISKRDLMLKCRNQNITILVGFFLCRACWRYLSVLGRALFVATLLSGYFAVMLEIS